jgi:Protein of unknown function (DUF1638).
VEERKKRYIAVVCEVLFREVSFCAAKSRSVITTQFVDQGLHSKGQVVMPRELQAIIDRIDCGKFDAILLIYGLCNNGILGLHADIPLVVPRAHDCITLLLGSKERYREYFDKNPGTFYKSSGWNERDYDGSGTLVVGDGSPRDELIYRQYVELYGEEEADYLMEALDPSKLGYNKVAFIDTGVGDVAYDREVARASAEEKEWEYEELEGDLGLLLRMLDGEWSEEEFLVIQPREHIEASFDETILKTSET